MYVGQTKQYFKENNNIAELDYLKKSDVHGSQATIPNGILCSHG